MPSRAKAIAILLATAAVAGCGPSGGASQTEDAAAVQARANGADAGTSEAALDTVEGATAGAGAAAGARALPVAPALTFTPPRGFFDAPVQVALRADAAGASIRYTLDGTEPGPDRGTVLAGGAIPVSRTTVIRARAFVGGAPVSAVETHTYLFLADVVRQSPDGAPPAGWPKGWGINLVDYGMDRRVVDDPATAAQLLPALRSLPTISLVMNLADLFDPHTGIYANAEQDGELWERPGSLELLHPDGRPGFQIDAGVRIRGGYSRYETNPKHAFRLFFRKRYGADTLDFPMFGSDAAQRFDKFDLRCAQNESWSYEADERAVFIRDQFSRDTQLAMGRQAERGDFYHLYINGQYWGLYNTAERPSADFAASYWPPTSPALGWDTVKVDPEAPYEIGATDGDLMAWTRLYDLVKLGPRNDALVARVQGLAPDGTRRADLEDLVDVDDLIDYMLVIFFTGNLDAPVSSFAVQGNSNPNNFYALRPRDGSAGFRFIAHDSEQTLEDVNTSRLGPYAAGDQSVVDSNPQWFFQKLADSAGFRARVAARVQRHFFGDGALTPAKTIPRFMRRAAEIERAVLAESARWGDAKRKPGERPLGPADWRVEVDRIATSYLPQRTAIVLAQLRARGLAP